MNEAGYANLMKLVSRAHLEPPTSKAAHIELATSRGARRGPDRADRRARRADRPGAARRPDGARRGAARRACKAHVRRPALRRAAAPRPQVRARRSSRSFSSSPTPMQLPARRHQRGLLRHARRLRGARCAAVHRRRPLRRRGQPAPRHARALLQDRRRDGGAVRRPARGARQHHRDRQALRLPPAGPQADPAALRRRRATTPSARPSSRAWRPRSCARQAEAGPRARALPPRRCAEGFTRADYEKRLAYELDVIARMKFPGYFLIVADFIKWAKAHGIPVGPGRGSGAGSVVAWALTITDLDPLRFGLLFERFLNPERVSMPDFDIDFCQERRDEVIRYVQRKYGHDRVAQIITHGKLQARAVLRDVGRVLQMPYGQVDRLCKLVPNNPANPVTLPRGHRRRAEAAGGSATPSRMVARLLEIAPEARGPLPPRLDARRRHGHRRPAAGRAGAALPRSQVQHARHPVQLEAGRGGGPREVRLPRPQDADRAAEGGRAREARARHRDRSRGAAARRQGDLRAARQGGHGRRVPAGKHGHARQPEAAQARPLRGHHRHGGALSPRPDGQHPDLHQPQARRGADRLSASAAGADPEGDLRRHHLPGAGDADRPGAGAATRSGEADLLRRAMGKKDKAEMATQQARFVEGAMQQRRRQGAMPPTSSSWSTSSPATASTSPTPPPMRSSAITRPT